jgi:superfamily II DNA or RNA helicase
MTGDEIAANFIRRFSSLQGRLDHVFLADRLAGAKAYRRIAGYFRSSLLELVGEQIGEIPDVRIVCNSDLDPADINVSKAAREAALKERWNDVDLGKESVLYADRYKRLYELLASGRVKIKVVPKEAIFVHGKAGVIELADGTSTAFVGSSNDSRNAFASNYEIVWEDPSKGAVEWVDREFETLWRMGHDLPDAIVVEIKRLADRVEVKFPDLKPEDLPAAVMVESPIYRSGEQLQPWQKSFVALFLKHRAVYGKARLLVADEVGLGKTLSMATAALVAALLDDGPVLILCPATLVYQWQTELNDRLGTPSAVWNSIHKAWIDPQGRSIRTRGFEDVSRCPYRIGIVSTGLITAGSPEAKVLQSQRFGTLVLDEAHKARLKGGLGPKEEANNLLAYMRIAAGNARHVLLGTATPIQTSVRELWDLVEILSVNAEFVLGRDGHSRWRRHEDTMRFVNGSESTGDPALAWDLLRAPLVPPEAPMLDGSARRLAQAIREDLNLTDKDYFTARSHTDLSSFTRQGDFEDTLSSDFFRRNNPFVQHVVLRRRKELEDARLLEPIAVDVHPDPDAKIGTYPGVTFIGRGLMTDFAFEQAYDYADQFIGALAQRIRSAGLLKSVFLQRICSSYASGLVTVTRMIERQADPEAEGPMQELELGALQSLEPKELELLHRIRDVLTQHHGADPKLNAVKWFLQDFRSPSAKGARWSELGCIVFTQYFDTADWVARQVAVLLPDQIVAVYAGAGRSGLFRGDKFVSEDRDVIKKMVRERSVKLVIATDAAAEGLNLQTLGTLINIDLPWNPSRLEQRLGRIKRFGQARDSVDMLNLVYHGTRDETVYETLSARMKDRFDIFGGLPDCIDDDWIEDIQEFEQLAQTHLHLRGTIRNIFHEKWGVTALNDEQDWESCARVLARSDVIERMSRGW